MTADLADHEARQQAAAIPDHFARAVAEIASLKEHRRSAAVWEMFMASEKAVKVRLRQQGTIPPTSHDLQSLVRLADPSGAAVPGLAGLPQPRQAIQHRYGELAPPDVAECFAMYQATLDFCEHNARLLQRTIEFRDATFYIKKLPWAKVNGRDDR